MPESKHRRNGEVRKRPTRNAPPTKNPPPSPAWVPVAGLVFLLVGLFTILAYYLIEPVGRFFLNWPVLGHNWPMALGFLFMIGGFGFLTRWR